MPKRRWKTLKRNTSVFEDLYTQQAAEVANKYLEQFLAADKVVFGFPMWNMTVPAVLHTYLDYLNQAGKTPSAAYIASEGDNFKKNRCFQQVSVSNRSPSSF
jgi:FMN-dependent NADH-azoreductase